MVSTSGVLAEEKRLVAAPRFAAARNPPTGESAGSTGASSPATAYATAGPKKAAATTRKTALISDVAAAVCGAVGGVETANSGTAAAGGIRPPAVPPGPRRPRA